MNLNIKSLTARLWLAILTVLLPMTAIACTPNPGTTPSTSTTSTIPADAWTFTLKVGVSADIATKYGGLDATRAKIDQQLADVNQVYATKLIHPVRWVVNELYVYTNISSDRFVPHPTADYLLMYSEDPVTDWGGYYFDHRVVVIRWPESNGGVFGTYGVNSLLHELGHARGATDVYAMAVDADKNPVNGQAYDPPTGYMNRWWDATDFDPYSKSLINASGSTPLVDFSVVRSSMPTTFSVKAVQGGSPVANASIEMYPVSWYSRTVSAMPAYAGVTGPSGVWQLSTNPFGLASGDLFTQYATFLVKVASGTTVHYSWMTTADAGNAYFAGITNFVHTASLG